MQLTGGQYKGAKIFTPHGVRPTLAVVRESVFNILYSHFGDFQGKKMLDMFLGSAIMTLEAQSRGFETVSFEINSSVIKTARENFQKFNMNGTIVHSDSLKKTHKLEQKFDVIYADPPWDYSYLPVFQICAQMLEKSGIAIIECDKKKKPDILKELNSVSTVELFKEKNYGRCCLLFLKLC